ncbi:uncharacterized protein KY384_005808 [Bacidia gigantensis]|uniref:uncharacterized protein n=1 Tax=Bacidia gigantensis TaxID=2732470 RepID=UPI001D038EB3|nr:uncharacterized protein KY384_005808 [Bacidia gigantensis]KAG8529173.1 hypothetical protein KY384_005808 [Bacidia gigantensis]
MNANSFKELQESIQKALVDTTRSAGQLANEDLAFHCASNPAVVPLLERQKSRLLDLVNDLTKVATKGTEVAAPGISDAEAIDDKWGGLVDVFDSLLEKADVCLDKYTGVIKKEGPSKPEKPTGAESVVIQDRLSRAKLRKPQLLFANPPSNHDTSPFKPLLKSKPHALTPLEECARPSKLPNGVASYAQPYEMEIKAARTSSIISTKREPVPYLPFTTTHATFVDTLEAVDVMLEELKGASEIAIDLEHHDEHSYIGIVCLMQISTREKDWIVDTLKPWRQELQKLNEVFADPNIVKVLHGSTMDIIWLQRDLGLYVVGLFDTYHASYALLYHKHGLAFLLKRFVDFDAAKKYQMADWRVRPLSEGMFDYARSDTHFLLYVFDMMRNELIDSSNLTQPGEDLLEEVMQKSKQESLQRYERPSYDKDRGEGLGGWNSMLYKTPSAFSREQFAVFRAVHQWRDTIARNEDESPSNLLSKKNLFSIARELPMSLPSLLACCHPLSKELKDHKHDLLRVVHKAKKDGKTGPEMRDFFRKGPSKADDQITVDGTTPFSKGVGAVIAAVRSQTPLPLRAKASQFWGSTLDDSKTGHPDKLAGHVGDHRLVLPLPDLTAEVFVDTKSPSASSLPGPIEPGSRAEHQYVKDKKVKENDVFVIRNSKKRKASDTRQESRDSDGASQNGASAAPEKMKLDTAAEDAEIERAERKRAKRQGRLERKLAKRENRSETQKGSAQNEPEPFDYENAPSVFHAKPTKEERAKNKGKAADPYAKSLNAPSGLPRVQRQTGGKSFTFTK